MQTALADARSQRLSPAGLPALEILPSLAHSNIRRPPLLQRHGGSQPDVRYLSPPWPVAQWGFAECPCVVGTGCPRGQAPQHLSQCANQHQQPGLLASAPAGAGSRGAQPVGPQLRPCPHLSQRPVCGPVRGLEEQPSLWATGTWGGLGARGPDGRAKSRLTRWPLSSSWYF